jgi:hypothetical protein
MVLSDDGKQLNDIGLEGEPWGIVVVPDKETQTCFEWLV